MRLVHSTINEICLFLGYKHLCCNWYLCICYCPFHSSGFFEMANLGGGGGHGGSVVTRPPPTSEVLGSQPRPYVGKLVVDHRWSAVYSSEP